MYIGALLKKIMAGETLPYPPSEEAFAPRAKLFNPCGLIPALDGAGRGVTSPGPAICGKLSIPGLHLEMRI